VKLITEDMLRVGQEALFDSFPECTIQEREDLAMAVYFAMRDAAEAKGNAGFSWDGFNITGDVQSVREVRRLVEFHAARRVEAP